jgi:hypothetical protein
VTGPAPVDRLVLSFLGEDHTTDGTPTMISDRFVNPSGCAASSSTGSDWSARVRVPALLAGPKTTRSGVVDG